MIRTTTDTLTPDTDPGEGGAILEKELPERNPPLLFGLGTIFCSGKYNMAFFQSAITTLQTLVIALGAGLGVWGGINLLEGYGNDNPGAKNQGIKQLMAGGGVALIGTTLIPLLSGLLG